MRKDFHARRCLLFGFCCLCILLAGTIVVAEQSRSQTQDEEYARLVKEWTTKPEFMSPLVDHLPQVDGIPSPKDVLGYHIGAPQKLTYYADILRYYRTLASATPRVKVIPIGKTHEGRENVVVVVGSDETMANLDSYRGYLARLADPRDLTESEAYDIIAKAKPIYHMSGGLHCPESAAPEMLMELAYRLAVEDSPIINEIRENVISAISPSLEPDGLDRFIDWVNAYRLDEKSDKEPSAGSPPYWGKYTYHDNNRDINVSQPNMRDVLAWYLEWHPPIMHDMHQSVPFLYTYSGNAPHNPTLDPIIFGEMPWFANFEMAQMIKYGMPGVWTHEFMDAWGVGYFASMSPNHNGLLRMYETFGNGTANTVTRDVSGGDNPFSRRFAGREWFRPVPASDYGEVEWSMRNSVNYVETAVLSGLQLTSEFPDVILENFYLKSRNSIEMGRDEAPFGYIIPAGQKDMTRVAFVVNILRVQGIEVGRATSEVSIGDDTFPAGSYIVKLDQPYGRLAKMLLEKQIYPDPDLRTYDDSGWTMGYLTHTEVKEIDDKAVLEVSVQPVDEVKIAGTVKGSTGEAIAVANYGSNHLATLRYRLKDLKVEANEETFEAEGTEFPPGSFIVSGGSDATRIKAAVEELGLTAATLSSPVTVPVHEVDLPRLAVYSTWGNTQEVGWVRHALDEFEIAYDLIFKERVRAGNLRADYDVILVPNQGRTAKGLVFDREPIGKPLAYKKTAQFKSLGMYGESDDVTGGMGLTGAEEIRKFVDGGGVLATYASASYFPPEFGITHTIDAGRPPSGFYAPGPTVKAEILKPSHPLFYGYPETTIPVRFANGPLFEIPERDREQQVLMRFPGGDDSVMSGLLKGAKEIKDKAAIVEVPVGKGRVLLFATNPCYRWQTWGEFKMMFNTIMHFNDMDAAARAKPTEETAGNK